MHDGEADAESTRFEQPADSAVSPGEPEASGGGDHGVNTALAERVAALERAVAERDPPQNGSTPPMEESRTPHRDDVVDRLEELHKRLDELDAAVQALRGYAGGVRAVNEEVERRADLALATARTASSGETDRESATEPAVDRGPPEESASRPNSPVEDRAVENGGVEDGAIEDGTVEAALPDQPAVAAAVPDATETDADDETGGNDGRTGGIAPDVVDRLRDAL